LARATDQRNQPPLPLGGEPGTNLSRVVTCGATFPSHPGGVGQNFLTVSDHRLRML
jgi:hypothetical protein